MSLFSVELPAQPGPAPLKHSGADMISALTGSTLNPKDITLTSANVKALRTTRSLPVAYVALQFAMRSGDGGPTFDVIDRRSGTLETA